MSKLLALFCVLATVYGAKVENRIAGGEDIDIKEAPYQVLIKFDNIPNDFCGGSIIAREWILTAGHCIAWNRIKAEKTSVGVGNSNSNHLRRFSISYFIVHPRIEVNSRSYFIYNIALLKLKEPLTYSDSIQPVKLAEAGQEIPAGTEVLATGWGLENDLDDDYPIFLKGVKLSTKNQTECNYLLVQEKIELDETQFCAISEGKYFCKGDTGGPLVLASDKTLIGVAAIGIGCVIKGKPNLFAKITDPEIRGWIKNRTGV